MANRKWLAAGIVAIASGTFLLYGLQLGDAGILQAGNIGPLIAVLVLGACIGFLPHNIHPARIFMGDGGALLLGLLLAASTMVTSAPSRRKACPGSTPIDPPPSTIRREGRASMSKIVSLLCAPT